MVLVGTRFERAALANEVGDFNLDVTLGRGLDGISPRWRSNNLTPTPEASWKIARGAHASRPKVLAESAPLEHVFPRSRTPDGVLDF